MGQGPMAENTTAPGKARCGLYLSGLLLLLVLLPALVLVPWWLQWNSYRETASEVAQRIARYRALLDSRGELKARLGSLRKQLKTGGYFIEAGNTELAAARMQQFVKEAVEKAGGALVSTQNLAGHETGQLQLIEIRVRMKGDVESLARVLLALEASRPVMTVEDLSIRSRRTVRGRRKNRVEGYSLDANFRVVGYLAEASP